MTAPAELVAQWEQAYRNYTHASQWADRADRNVEAAQAMAASSWEVAQLWRAMAGLPAQPWWIVAGLRAAAEAFNSQANTWHDRAMQPPSRRATHIRQEGQPFARP